MEREAKEHAARTGGGALLPFPGDTEHQLDATCPLCAHVDRETGLITAPVLRPAIAFQTGASRRSMPRTPHPP